MWASALKFRHKPAFAMASPWAATPVSSVNRQIVAFRAEPTSRTPAAPAKPVAAELVGLDQMLRYRADWHALVPQALERNVFLEPAFALAAAQHFAIAQRPRFLLAWSVAQGIQPRKLIGLCPIAPAKGFGRGLGPGLDGGLARGWLTRQAALGTPLLDRAFAAEALAAMLNHVATAMRYGSLLLAQMPQDGATARLIRATAVEGGRDVRLLGAYRRACLSGGDAGMAALDAGLSSKRKKEVRRQRHRLEATQALDFVSARGAGEVRQAVEYFLRLEAGGWKGAGGTALLCDPGETAFVRAATRGLAEAGKCRVDMLMRGDTPVAMAIVLHSGASAAYWKIAHDENFAAHSPGVLLTLDTSRRQVADAAIAMTDSCAIAGHPMIDRVWPERMPVADMLIATRPGHAASFGLTHARVALAGRLREAAKSAYHRWRKR